jgi:hypothetical protein
MATKNRVAPSKSGESDWNLDTPSTAEQLLEQFTRIEQAWKKAEERIASTHCPIDVRVNVSKEWIYGSNDCIQGETRTYLAYFRVKGSRRICFVVESRFDHPEIHPVLDSKPITEMPVDIRLEMFDHFQQLFDEVETVSKSYVPKIKERVDRFEAELDRNLLF